MRVLESGLKIVTVIQVVQIHYLLAVQFEQKSHNLSDFSISSPLWNGNNNITNLVRFCII